MGTNVGSATTLVLLVSLSAAVSASPGRFRTYDADLGQLEAVGRAGRPFPFDSAWSPAAGSPLDSLPHRNYLSRYEQRAEDGLWAPGQPAGYPARHTDYFRLQPADSLRRMDRPDQERMDPGRLDSGRMYPSRVDIGRFDQWKGDQGRVDQWRSDQGRSDQGRLDQMRWDQGRVDQGRLDTGRMDFVRGDHGRDDLSWADESRGDRRQAWPRQPEQGQQVQLDDKQYTVHLMVSLDNAALHNDSARSQTTTTTATTTTARTTMDPPRRHIVVNNFYHYPTQTEDTTVISDVADDDPTTDGGTDPSSSSTLSSTASTLALSPIGDAVDPGDLETYLGSDLRDLDDAKAAPQHLVGSGAPHVPRPHPHGDRRKKKLNAAANARLLRPKGDGTLGVPGTPGAPGAPGAPLVTNKKRCFSIVMENRVKRYKETPCS